MRGTGGINARAPLRPSFLERALKRLRRNVFAKNSRHREGIWQNAFGVLGRNACSNRTARRLERLRRDIKRKSNITPRVSLGAGAICCGSALAHVGADGGREN